MRTQKKRPGYQRGAPRSGCFSLSAAKIVLSLAMETSVSMDTGRNTCNSACDMRGRCINDKKIAAELHQTSRGPKCTPGPAGAGRAHSNRSTALLRAEMGPVSQSVSYTAHNRRTKLEVDRDLEGLVGKRRVLFAHGLDLCILPFGG